MLALVPGSIVVYTMSRVERDSDIPWMLNNRGLLDRIDSLEGQLKEQGVEVHSTPARPTLRSERQQLRRDGEAEVQSAADAVAGMVTKQRVRESGEGDSPQDVPSNAELISRLLALEARLDALQAASSNAVQAADSNASQGASAAAGSERAKDAAPAAPTAADATELASAENAAVNRVVVPSPISNSCALRSAVYSQQVFLPAPLLSAAAFSLRTTCPVPAAELAPF